MNQAAVSLLRVPDRPGIAAKLFGGIAVQNLDVDLIIQSIHESNSNDITFTVERNYFNKAIAVADALLPALGKSNSSDIADAEVTGDDTPIAKVSIVGAGMIGRPKVASQMFNTLAEAGINIQMISTSEVKVSCVIAAEDCQQAVSALCQSFEMSSDCKITSNFELEKPLVDPSLPPVRGVALDVKQARLAIRHVPDRPGMAAKIFSILADHNISVDMIIQSQRCHQINGMLARDIAFTVAQGDADEAERILTQAASELGHSEIILNKSIAKVSVVGSGMIHHPGVAAKMFEALANRNINILMIATSEIKISCLVDEDQGVEALKAVHEVFELSGDQTFIVPERAPVPS